MNADPRLDSADVIISRRFRGPPNSANGGFACGLIGCRLHGPARVRLSEPPPLETSLTLRTPDERSAELILEGRTIGRAETADRAWDVPAPVTFELAAVASPGFPWFTGHPFASCFVCGPERAEMDGLRIFPGAVAERKVVAAPWVPAASVCDASGMVQPEIVWAALDCPSWFGIFAFEPDAQYALLGELTAHIVERPREGGRCVVLGWSRGRDGRKLYGGTAIFSDDGQLLASSAATWIELKPGQTTY
jgi:hypothetical protein